MSPPNIIIFGVFVFVLLSGSQAQQTFHFSSFSQIPQSLLDELPPDQVENLRNNIPAHGQVTSPPKTQPSASNPSGGSSPGSNPSGGSSPGSQTFQFSSFSQIPQSLLDKLPPDQVENLRNQIPAHAQVPSPPQAQPSPASPSGGSSPGSRTFQFKSFSDIPQSLLDQLSSDQIRNLKNQLPAQGKVPSTPQKQIPSTPQEQMPSSSSIPTFQIGGGSPGGNLLKSLQFSKFSDIPQSVLDQLSSDQIKRIRILFSQQNQPIKQTTQPPPKPQPSQQMFEFSRFSQIPNSILSQFSSEQIREIQQTLQNQKTMKLPASTSNRFNYSIPEGDNKRENDFLNIVFNYVAAGGYLTGIPPVDLLLIRFYILMGPKNFC